APSFIESTRLDPLADRLNCRFEFTRQRGDAAPAARQFNDSTPVFCCVWWMRSGHLENSFSLSPTPSTKLGQLQVGVFGWGQSTQTAVGPELVVILAPGFDQVSGFGEPEEKMFV